MEDMQKQTESLPLGGNDCVEVADKEKPAFCNKFATAGELEKAYDSLQKEFTRKCQQNSELTKALQHAQDLSQAKEQSQEQSCGEPYAPRPEGQENDLPTVDNGGAATTPAYELPDWDEKVEKFMKDYPSAQRYIQSIARVLASNPEISIGGDCLEKAYFKVLLDVDRPYEELASDDGFIEKYVMNNEKVKDRIIAEFLRKNMDVRIPEIIAGSGRTCVTPPSRPKSISEAGGIVKNMLANRRI